MSLVKNCSKVAAYVALAALIVIAIIYIGFLNPKKRAATHLEFVHKAIDEMHPAVLETDAAAFHEWHEQGYEQAKALLPLVHTEADEGAVLRFYLAGYKDSHLNGYLDHTPYSKLDADKRKWTGWLLKATNSGYVVTYRKEGNQYPPENAHLLSCDGKAIDELLHKYYAPYFDIRWNILNARDTAAKAFTQDRSFTGVLNRPEFHTCDFLIDNITKTYPIEWVPISTEESNTIAGKSYSEYKLPSLTEMAPGKIWVRASDFALHSPEAAQSQKRLLEDITSIKQKTIIVLDARGNSGGSSIHGSNIFNAIFGEDKKAANYLANQYQYKNQGSNALFRASWQLYWSYDYTLKKAIANQGEESAEVQYLEKFQVRLKKALDAGEKTLYQKEEQEKNTRLPEPADEWDSPIKLVLITDKYCVSACLDFVDMVKLAPSLLHIGEPTDADTAYTQIAYMQSQYAKETYNFMVPVKKWNKRMRDDNQPYIPDVIYEGDMSDDKALREWVINQTKIHFNQ